MKKLLPLLFALIALLPLQAKATEGFIGEIRMFAGNFAPKGWAFCQGQELEISKNTALFSILGTTYGGDGRKTFALPDLRGKAPVHPGGEGGGKLGGFKTGQKVARSKGDEADPSTQSTLRIHYIICVTGLFPQRS